MSLVYFIQAGADGPIKIGIAGNVWRRLGKMQSDSPYQLTVLAAQPGTEADEARLHARFAPYRIRGEWFWPCPELVRHIASLGNAPAKPRPHLTVVPSGNPMRAMRIAMGLKQGELASLLGMQQPHVCRLEKAPSLPHRTLLALEAIAARLTAQEAAAA